MTERMTAWQCIGCGRIEGAQPCVGICQVAIPDGVCRVRLARIIARVRSAIRK